MRVLFFSTMLLISASVSYAQNYASIGYNGAYITHPGLEAGFSHTLYTKSKNDSMAASEFRAGASLGFYFHKNRHTALYVTPSIEWIRTTKTGFQYGVSLPVGIIKTFVPQVYEIQDNGIVREKLTGPSYGFFMPGIRLGRKVTSRFFDEWYVKNKFMIIPGQPLHFSVNHILELSIVKKLN
jgi:hypothetical protein